MIKVFFKNFRKSSWMTKIGYYFRKIIGYYFAAKLKATAPEQAQKIKVNSNFLIKSKFVSGVSFTDTYFCCLYWRGKGEGILTAFVIKVLAEIMSIFKNCKKPVWRSSKWRQNDASQKNTALWLLPLCNFPKIQKFTATKAINLLPIY